ncbi:hypothetical protein [Amycolatopsis dongchuanensis]|uniref:Phage major capsid protein n=1 Tax=Amycolatopsis dongchuanensis TaxID=1070866 RepID=A0ABP8VJT7_9PSEU
MLTMENPVLTAHRAQYEKLRAEIENVQWRSKAENRDLTEDELRQIEEKSEQLRNVADQIEYLVRNQERQNAVAAVATRIGMDTNGIPRDSAEWAPLGTSVPMPIAEDKPRLAHKIMPSREEMNELYRAVQDGRNLRFTVSAAQDAHTRAAITTTDTGTPAVALDYGRLREPRRLAIAAGIPTTDVAGVSEAVYPVFGSEGAADIVEEGALKPEYDDVSEGSATPQVISLWTDYSRQVSWTMPSFEIRLRQKLAARLCAREDQLLIGRVNATTGVQTYTAGTGESPVDSLLVAAGMVLSSDVGAEPNLVAINPADLVRLFGSSTGGFGESPEENLRLRLRGMDVYPTSAVAAGSAVVGAWDTCAQVVIGLQPTWTVDSLSQVKNNLITVLVEEALTLAIDEPTGFVKVTFATAE